MLKSAGTYNLMVSNEKSDDSMTLETIMPSDSKASIRF